MNEKESNPIPNRDFSSDILRLQSMKAEGNQLINTDINEAIKKYDETNKELYTLLRTTSEREKENNPQLKQIETIKTQLASNLSLCYFKLKDYHKSIDYDKIIISTDLNYDKSYARLFKCSIELNDGASAVRYGRILKVWFNQETLDKYQDIINEIEAIENRKKSLADLEREKEDKKVQKKKMIRFIPYILILTAVTVYSVYYK